MRLMPVLRLYTRPGCCLCQQAEEALAAAGIPFERREVDSDPAWQAAYSFEVPVLTRRAGEGEEVLQAGRICISTLP